MAKAVGAGVRAAARQDGGGIVFRRWLGCWIDFIAVALLGVIAATPFAAAPTLSDTSALTVGLLGIGLAFAYFILAEGLTGRTLGKLVTGTIVVNAAGQPPGIGRAVIRTLLRVIEVNPFLLGGLPAGIVVALTKHKQRLGDLAAGTYVVPIKALGETTAAPVDVAVFD